MSPGESSAPAGWYADSETDRERFWDGNAWTDRVRSSAGGPDEQIEVNRAGVGLTLGGAALLIVALFLPELEGPGIVPVKQNSIAQNGQWEFLIAAVVAVAATYRVVQQRRTSYALLVVGLVVIGFAVYYGTGDRLELNSVLTGAPIGRASPGIGLFAAGFAGVLIAAGGLLLAGHGIWFGGEQTAPRLTKTCPDCAETILADARVCRHCGYRFDAPGDAGPPSKSEAAVR